MCIGQEEQDARRSRRDVQIYSIAPQREHDMDALNMQAGCSEAVWTVVIVKRGQLVHTVSLQNLYRRHFNSPVTFPGSIRPFTTSATNSSIVRVFDVPKGVLVCVGPASGILRRLLLFSGASIRCTTDSGSRRLLVDLEIRGSLDKVVCSISCCERTSRC